MKWRDLAKQVSLLGLSMVAVVIGNGCQPPPQEVPDSPASTATDGDGVENPSTVIDTDPDMDPRNTQGS